ncbi:polysaccharide biosynthesis protein [Lysinibacillus sphaericus]|uniref:oligosaccharide flippase family protein n=1 Tax=Lysinibacillus sphaericus TaxID=1421 RepID=UPI0018CCE810|nr:oligosaccharide flippase family protein [Lysinibacillus sphaericus]MBG9455252.1 polysaccharide biosynthesis protein [Lysinibacillus sphaericus]MBG9478795.1 polysaccharide biosynthesis protein [Lysinibacillus sphaericus]MBG9592523.1 polysaccharide biosynthesis protein [Lysinibacillus sphaericus]
MKEIRMGAILSYLSIVCTFIVAIVFTPIMIRILGQEEYGLYTLITVFVGYLTILDFGLGNAIIRYISNNRVVGDKEMEARLNGFFLRLFSIIGVFTLAIGCFVYFQVETIFGQSLSSLQIEKAKVMVMVMTVSFTLQFPLSVFSSILQAYEKFILIKLTSFIKVIVQPILMLFFLLQDADAVGMVYIVASLNVCVLIINSIICLKTLKVRFIFSGYNPGLIKEIFVYSFFLFVTVIVDKIYWQTDQVLLGIMKGTEDVAIYAIAIQFIMIFMALALAISDLYLPKISMLVTQTDGLMEINRLFVNVGAIQLMILGYVLSGFFLFGKTFISLWIGDEYLIVYPIVLIIMLPFSVDLIQNIGLSVLKAKNMFKFRTVLLITLASTNIILSIPAIYFFGGIGTAIITAVSLFIGNVCIMNVYYAKKIQLTIKKFWIRISKIFVAIVIASLLMKGILIVFPLPNTWYILGLYIALYSMIFGISLFTFGITASDRKYLIGKVKMLSLAGGVKFWGQKSS